MEYRSDLTEDQFRILRLRMVEDQLVRREVTDTAVLAAMRKVPRHKFVPGDQVARAYGDHPLDIGHDQTISQPYIVASMTQELHLSANSRVLEVGTGCGYQTAILAELVRDVYTIERIAELHHGAVDRLRRLGYSNVKAIIGDGSLGWVDHAPYDGILVTAAAIQVPKTLLDQLNDPGRMVIPVGPPMSNQELVLIEKNHGRLKQTGLYGVRFVPLRTSESDSEETGGAEQ
jgi:protein-L-isoaspartate(D-aspartate) O-methyltransferase